MNKKSVEQWQKANGDLKFKGVTKKRYFDETDWRARRAYGPYVTMNTGRYNRGNDEVPRQTVDRA
jgi:hypothetical protein